MSANVDSMFSVREVPWHRLGNVPDHYPASWDEARELAGLGWDLERVPAWIRKTSPEKIKTLVATAMLDAAWDTLSTDDQVGKITAILEGAFAKDPDFDRIRRDDTDVSLSYQMDSWNAIYHRDFGDIIDALVKEGKGMVKVETGGSLDDGKKVWMLVRLGKPMEFKGDRSLTFPYFGLTCRHDGTASLVARLTAIRIVCQNTLLASEAEGEATGAVYKFSHRVKDIRDQLDRAREALQFADGEIAKYVAAMENLLGINVTEAQTELFISQFIPMPVKLSDIVTRNIEKNRQHMRDIIAGPTVAGAGAAGTAGGLGLAAGEFCDYYRRSNTVATMIDRNILKPEPLRASAMKLARQVALAV